MTGVAIANQAMEGAGYYNRNSGMQAAGIALVLPLLEAAAGAVAADGDRPLVIADYGCSQGRNSMLPMGLAIDAIRQRFASRPIEIVHTDLPSNDFASLFRMLDEDESSYLKGRPNLFPSAIGRSYFEPILPPASVHLGWNTWTLHWMSRNPVQVDDHLLAICGGSASAREAVRHQLAADWRAFLSARAAELAPGGKLISLMMGCGPERHGWEWVGGETWNAGVEMAEEGLVSREELLRFTAPAAGRTVEALAAPFVDGPFNGLSLDHAEVMLAPDPFWEEYCETGDAEQLGKRWAGMNRAVCGPIAAAAFASRANCEALVDDLYARLATRIAAHPQRHEHYLAIAVVSKAGS